MSPLPENPEPKTLYIQPTVDDIGYVVLGIDGTTRHQRTISNVDLGNVGYNNAPDSLESLTDETLKTLKTYLLKVTSNRGHTQYNENINASIILGKDVGTRSNQTMFLIESFASTALYFAIGLYSLWTLSVGIAITVFSVPVAIPGYMALAAISYALAYHYLTSRFSRSLKKDQAKIQRTDDKLTSHLHHIEMHGESIALKQGAEREKNRLLVRLKKRAAALSSMFATNSILRFINSLHFQLQNAFGLLLSLPNVINGKLEGINVFSVAFFFSQVVNMFTWLGENAEDISSLQVSVKRLDSFEKMMAEWEEKINKKDLQETIAGEEMKIEINELKTPNGTVLIKEKTIRCRKGTATLLKGPSGIGKTTLQRSLSGLWPYVNGNLILPEQGEGKKT